mmetsp:Transcript_29553/g.49675  ORF Transcript_29553/g.49675 Transcript_29553/m.49675 type:complete len:310 (+) Transcript_29553:2-931(+)
MDLNCGCPIYEATRRGLGAKLLAKPHKLLRLVEGIATGSPLPLSVKVRTGAGNRINLLDNVLALQDAGAAILTVHGRTMDQRYRSAADWDLIAAAAESVDIPIVGNGDVLSYVDANVRLRDYGCAAVMTGRGALIKPWIFKEFEEQASWQPTCEERVGVYFRLVEYMKEHFGDDEMGRRKAFYFLPWHFSFFCRYRPFPEESLLLATMGRPLITQRQGRTLESEDPASLSSLEFLLRVENEEAHEAIAAALWSSETVEGAVLSLEALAHSNLAEWQAADVETRGTNRLSEVTEDGCAAQGDEDEKYVSG